MNCNSLNIRLKIVKPSQTCAGCKQQKTLENKDIFPQGICPFLFNAIYPYYLTLKNDGWFSWVPKGGCVIVQCANPHGSTEVEIGIKESSADTPVIFARVRNVRGECPNNYKINDTFEFSEQNSHICLTALGSFLPYLMIVSQGGQLPWQDDENNNILHCPDDDCDASFIVERIEENEGML